MADAKTVNAIAIHFARQVSQASEDADLTWSQQAVVTEKLLAVAVTLITVTHSAPVERSVFAKTLLETITRRAQDHILKALVALEETDEPDSG